jgi:hypothetical protein
MNNILPSGKARIGQNEFDDKLSFEFRSTIAGENAGLSLNSPSDALFQNYFNTFVGYQSGRNSVYSKNSTFIGYNAGNDISIGSNNIYLGNEFYDEDENVFRKTRYDVLSIGINNKTNTNSITVGTQNRNLGYKNIVSGIGNNLKDNENILIGCDNDSSNNSSITLGSYNFNSGFKNIVSGHRNRVTNSENILIGHDNITSNILHSIIIGKNNFLQNTVDYINIGNNLTYPYKINIGDTFLKYSTSNDDMIFLGLHSSNVTPTAIGFLNTEIEFSSNFSYISSNRHSLYVKNGTYTDKLTIGKFDSSNINKYSISLTCPLELISNIEYVLPKFPENYKDIFLTTNDRGIMSWKEIDVQTQIDDNLNLDKIRNGTSNQYIQNGVYKSNLHVDGLLVVNKLQVLGTDVTNYNTQYVQQYSANMSNYTVQEIDKKIADLRNIYDEQIANIKISNGVIDNLFTDKVILKDRDTQKTVNIIFKNNELILESDGIRMNVFGSKPILNQHIWMFFSLSSAQFDITDIPFLSNIENTNFSKVLYVSIRSTEIENIVIYSVMLILDFNSSKAIQNVSFHILYSYYPCDTLTYDVIANILFLSNNTIEIIQNNINVELSNDNQITMMAKNLNIDIPMLFWKKETDVSTQYDIYTIQYKHINDNTKCKVFQISLTSSSSGESIVIYSAIVYATYNSSNVFIGIFYHLIYSHYEPSTIRIIENNGIPNEIKFSNNSIKIENAVISIILENDCKIFLSSEFPTYSQQLKVPFWSIQTSEPKTYDIDNLSLVKSLSDSDVMNRIFDVSIFTNDFFVYSACINIQYDIISNQQLNLESSENFSYLSLEEIKPIYKNNIQIGLTIMGTEISFENDILIVNTTEEYTVSIVSY